MRSFKSNENIHKKEGGSYYVVTQLVTHSDVIVGFMMKETAFVHAVNK